MNTTPLGGKQGHNHSAVATSTSDNMESTSARERITAISPEVLEYMDVINELLNTTEAQQMAFINKIEVH